MAVIIGVDPGASGAIAALDADTGALLWVEDMPAHEGIVSAPLSADLIVVCIGAGHSAGYPMEAGWDAVTLSNLRKIDTATGQVLRREDGKILKPEGWRPPNLARLLGEHHG